MLRLNPSLSVAAMLILSGCCSNPSVLPTIARQIPSQCLTQCMPIPDPLSGSDLDIRRWEFEAIEAFGLCRRLHGDCVESVMAK